ncbi:NAD-dependent epimerase/dehydratase family protein, partial [Aegicerativicinus sediminis]
LIGAHLLYKLVSEGETVRAIYRRQKKLKLVEQLFCLYSEDANVLYNKIDWIEADLNDIPALERAFEGVTTVYHLAAFVSFEPDKYQLLRKINIEGTANIVNIAISNKVEKLCFASSVAAIGQEVAEGDPITEESPWSTEKDHNVYAISKYGAEKEVWRGTQEGLDAVIVNPGVVIGPGFWKSGSSGSLITKVHKGIKYYTTGSTGYIDVIDLVEVMTFLMKSEIKNERYILVSENLTFKQFLNHITKALGIPPPSKKANKTLLEIGWRLDWLAKKLFGKRRSLTKQLTESLTTLSNFDNSKIKRIYPHEFKPMEVSIKETVEKYKKDFRD